MPLSPTLNKFINQAADRLEELQLELTETRDELNEAQLRIKHLTDTGMHAVLERDKAIEKAEKAYKLGKESEIERDSLRDTMAIDMLQLTKERDEARAELERLKDTVSAYEQATVNQQLTIRPDPSRLEIAAMFLSGFAASDTSVIHNKYNFVLAEADALIAAAKEGAK